MKKKNYVLVILVMLLYITSGQDLLGQTPSDSIQHLLGNTWDLIEVEVDTNSYTDEYSTDLQFDFDSNGTVLATSSDSSSGTIPWKFSTMDPSQMILNEGTTEEQVFTVKLLSTNFFIYSVNYTVNGIVYNYIFKFRSI